MDGPKCLFGCFPRWIEYAERLFHEGSEKIFGRHARENLESGKGDFWLGTGVTGLDLLSDNEDDEMDNEMGPVDH